MDEGESFGSRRFTESFQIFLFGFCGFLDWARRSPRALTALVCLVLAAWILSFVLQVRRGDLPKSSNFAFSDATRESVGQLYEIIGHPGAVPANWIFAWTYGVPPDRFDTLFGGRSYHDLTIDVGTKADVAAPGTRLVDPGTLPGWVPLSMVRGREPSWFVTLFRPFRYRLRVEGEPAPSPDRGPQVLDVEVNGASAGRLAFAPGISAAEIPVNERFWRRGLNEIVFRYRYTVDAGEAYDGSDPRRIALRLERLELRIEKVHPPVSSR